MLAKRSMCNGLCLILLAGCHDIEKWIRYMFIENTCMIIYNIKSFYILGIDICEIYTILMLCDQAIHRSPQKRSNQL